MVINYWDGRAAIFWAPIWGGLKFSEPAFRRVTIFWAPLGDVRVLMGFVLLKY